MTKTFRTLALALAGAFALSACGALSGLIPDQTISGGVLGVAGGVDVTLEAEGAGTAALAPAAGADATVWVGTVTGSTTIDAIAELPSFVNASTITETVALGNSIVVTHPGTDTGPFTVTGLAVGGTVTIGGTAYALPAGIGVTGLSVLFADPLCVSDGGNQVCTYTTASNVPEVEVALAANQVAAFSALLKGSGGEVSASLTVTVTLAGPGLPDDASVVVTLESLDAVVSF